MATNSSEHLGLHLWEPNDQVLRTEFNENWQKLDTAVEAAQEAAEAAQTEAEDKGYVIGSYTGNAPDSGDDPGQLINLGFQPGFTTITRGWTNNTPGGFLAIGQMRNSVQDTVFELKSNGFMVRNPDASGPIKLNTSGVTYDYIAFR